jgi:hypothetical protein
MILFKGNLKVNLPLTFKSHNYNNSQSYNKRQHQSIPNHHRNTPNINFRPHYQNNNYSSSRQIPPPPNKFQNKKSLPPPPRPNLNNFIMSENPGHRSRCKTLIEAMRNGKRSHPSDNQYYSRTYNQDSYN